MKLLTFTIENFRAYREPQTVKLDDLTTIVGRNDIGKSSILEAMEIFFNNKAVSIDQQDSNINSESKKVIITAEFEDPNSEFTLDAGAPTTLAQEYLLSQNGTLIIRKEFDCSNKTPKQEVFIVANHPTAGGVNNLLELKERELQAHVRKQELEVALKGNPGMRQALWAAAEDLKLEEVHLQVTKPVEDSKRIWEQIDARLPMFALFQSDRQSKESDGEVQNPLKGAISAAIAEVQDEIDAIQRKVREKSEEIAELTHKALQDIDPNLARSLSPKFTAPTTAKWTGLFSLGMNTDDGIPLDKRGSGVRRLILVSFFKAEAERKLTASGKGNIIYAIEEPETSQHPKNQRILIDSFKELALGDNCQIVLTTHSPGLAGELPVDGIRYVRFSEELQQPMIESGADVYGDVAKALGVTPDSRVKVLMFVEGPTDVAALNSLSRALHLADPDYPDLSSDPRVAFVLSGGSTLKHWVSENYLGELNKPEVHIYDGDVAGYADSVAEVNGRTDGLGSWAVQTAKHEIESYIHADAIQDAYGVVVEVVDHPTAAQPAVPRAFAQVFSADRRLDGVMRDTTAKAYLSRAFERMTADRIDARDPDGEVREWIRRIGEMIAE